MNQAVVQLGDEVVGLLVREGRVVRFEPAEAWAEQAAGVRPVLGQQFEDDPFAGHVGQNHRGLPLWFEHLLPEHGGRLRGIVAKEVGVDPDDGFELLLAMGEDLPGAVRVRAAEPDDGVRTVARRVRGRASSAIASGAASLRVSLAGVQLKISARLDGGRLAVPGWDDVGDWIIKFSDLEHRALPETEFVTMRWAAASGITVPPVRLMEAKEIAGFEDLGLPGLAPLAFGIERYDRCDGVRLHQEDFAQVLGLGMGTAKYEETNFDTVVRVSRELIPIDLDQLLSRIVFSVVSGNDDAHAKNWSLWYPTAATPRLAPAYDQVCGLSFPQYSGNQMALYLAGKRGFEQVTTKRFRQLAQRVALDADRVDSVVREAVTAQVSGWEQVRGLPEVPPQLREFIDRWLTTLPLVKDVLGENRS